MADFKTSEPSKGPNSAPFCFLNVYKPAGITSFDVIYKLRKHLGVKKIGHFGTLDPLADGVMQVAVGRATRCLEYLGSDKKYLAKIRFGYMSSTGDCEGEISSCESSKFNQNELLEAIDSIKGEIEQVPPIYSAVKVGGKRLYEIARKGNPCDIKIPPRVVKIYEAKLINFNISEEGQTEVLVEIYCSKGTYIRSYAIDLAKKLGTGAYLTSLTRTLAGNFKLEDSVKIDEVSLERDGILPHLALQNKIYDLNEGEYKLVLNGVSFFPRVSNIPSDEPFSLVYKNNLVSIAVLRDNKFICKKVFN